MDRGHSLAFFLAKLLNHDGAVLAADLKSRLVAVAAETDLGLAALILL